MQPSTSPQPITPEAAVITSSTRDAAASRGTEYDAPQLTVYGRLADVTAKVGTKGKRDGSGNRRTGF